MESQEQVFLDLDLSQTMAVQILPDLNMTPLEFNDGYMTDQLLPTVDYGDGYLNMPFYIQQPDRISGTGQDLTIGQSTGGPFLSVQQPASPDLNAITPRQAHFAHHTPNLNLPLYHNDDEDGGDLQGQGYSSLSNENGSGLGPVNSRYVSGSAFPDTPLSVDPSGLGGLDRRISYANNANTRLDWPDDVDDEIKNEPTGSPMKSSLGGMPFTPLSPSNQPPDGSRSPGTHIKSPVPRPGRRARSVASAYT